MGQRCSCLFNKPENEIQFKKEEHNPCNDQFIDNIKVRAHPEDYISNSKEEQKNLEKIGRFIEICGIIIFKHILFVIVLFSKTIVFVVFLIFFKKKVYCLCVPVV